MKKVNVVLEYDSSSGDTSTDESGETRLTFVPVFSVEGGEALGAGTINIATDLLDISGLGNLITRIGVISTFESEDNGQIEENQQELYNADQPDSQSTGTIDTVDNIRVEVTYTSGLTAEQVKQLLENALNVKLCIKSCKCLKICHWHYYFKSLYLD